MKSWVVVKKHAAGSGCLTRRNRLEKNYFREHENPVSGGLA
jgi:hypothetical protein